MSLKKIRESVGLSRAELSIKSGINQRIIESYEQGKRDINGAKLKTLVKLSTALCCNIKDIVDEEELLKLLEEHDIGRVLQSPERNYYISMVLNGNYSMHIIEDGFEERVFLDEKEIEGFIRCLEILGFERI